MIKNITTIIAKIEAKEHAHTHEIMAEQNTIPAIIPRAKNPAIM